MWRELGAQVTAVAQHERERIAERVKQGQAIAKSKGIHIGRPPVMTPFDIRCAKRKIDRGECTISDIAEKYGIHPWTVTRSLRRLEDHN